MAEVDGKHWSYCRYCGNKIEDKKLKAHLDQYHASETRRDNKDRK